MLISRRFFSGVENSSSCVTEAKPQISLAQLLSEPQPRLPLVDDARVALTSPSKVSFASPLVTPLEQPAPAELHPSLHSAVVQLHSLLQPSSSGPDVQLLQGFQLLAEHVAHTKPPQVAS